MPAPTGAPVAANANAATATSALATATCNATGTPVPPTRTRTATPFPIRPGSPVVTPGPASPATETPGTPGTPGTPAAGASDQDRTAAQIFAPYRPGGLVESLRATATVSGYCIGGAQTLPGRPDAWRCASGGCILDPCFASATPDLPPLTCAAGPWSDEIILLNLAAPLPRDRANGAFGVAAMPWGLQLANGVRRQSIPAAGATVAGMAVTAVCNDGSQLLGDPDRAGGRWRVL